MFGTTCLWFSMWSPSPPGPGSCSLPDELCHLVFFYMGASLHLGSHYEFCYTPSRERGSGCFPLWPPGCSQLLTPVGVLCTVRAVTPTTCLNRSCFNQHTHIYTVLAAHVCVHVYMYMCIHMYVHIYMYTHTYIYTSLCMYNLQLKLLQVCGMWVALSLVSLEWYLRHSQSPSWKSLVVIRLPTL